MKIPNNLAEIYVALMAKRPEMKVYGLAWVQDPSGCITLWNRSNEGIDWRRLQHDEAAALIRSHWEDKLPENHALYKAYDTWSVVRLDFVPATDSYNLVAYPGDMYDPITALYHYHISSLATK